MLHDKLGWHSAKEFWMLRVDFHYFEIISHLKGGSFPLKEVEFPFNKGCFVPSFAETD